MLFSRKTRKKKKLIFNNVDMYPLYWETSKEGLFVLTTILSSATNLTSFKVKFYIAIYIMARKNKNS